MWNSWHRDTINRLIEAYGLTHHQDDIVPALRAALVEIDRLTTFVQLSVNFGAPSEPVQLELPFGDPPS